MGASALSLKARALQWLAQREHSRGELQRKLMRLARQRIAASQAGQAGQATPSGVQDDRAERARVSADLVAEIEALLDSLQADRYLSEQRFVESRVNARLARYGNVRIRQELRQHGSSLDVDSESLLQASEAARARAVWLRKFGPEPASAAAARARQMRFLAGRGFSSEVIRDLIRARGRGPDDDGAPSP